MRSPRTRGRPGRPLSLLLALLCALRAKVGARRASLPGPPSPSPRGSPRRLRLSVWSGLRSPGLRLPPGPLRPVGCPWTRGTPGLPNVPSRLGRTRVRAAPVPRGPSCRIVPTLEPLKPGNRVESLHPVLQNEFHLAPRARRGGRGGSSRFHPRRKQLFPALTSLPPSPAGVRGLRAVRAGDPVYGERERGASERELLRRLPEPGGPQVLPRRV